MRNVLVVLLVFLGTWAGLGVLEAKEAEDARVRARIREYTEAATAELRRAHIAAELSGADGAVVARLLRETLLNDTRRGAALDLATRLRLPGLFDAARRHADGDHEARVIAYALASPDDAAAAWLVERWTSSAPESERFRKIDDALRAHRAAPAVVRGIGEALADTARAGAALLVLQSQMAIDDASPDALRARWDAAWATYLHEAREFPREGTDLLDAPGWRLGSARPVGRNLRLAPATSIDLAGLPIAAQMTAGTLRLRIAPGDGARGYVSLATSPEEKRQDLRLRCDGTSWYLVEGPPREGARVEAACRAGQWSILEMRIVDPRLPGEPGARDIRVLLDGTELRPSGGIWRLSTPPASLSVGASCGSAPTLVGGVTWRAAPP